MTVSSSSGTKVFIHPPVSATNARYLDQLPDWVEIGEVEDIDDIGETFGVVQRTFFSNGPRVEHLKTVTAGATVSVSIGRDYDDNGQSILNDALSSRDSYLFKVELNDARFVDYANSRLIFRALVLGVNTAVGGNDNIVRRNASLQINSEIYELLSEPQSDAIASLSLDFMNNRAVVVSPNSPLVQTINDAVNFSRLTNAWDFNDAGVLTQYAPNVLRRNSNGALLERAGTNLLPYSQGPFNTSPWTATGSTTLVTGISDAGGGNAGVRVLRGTGTAGGLQQSGGIVGDGQAKSIWARSPDGMGSQEAALLGHNSIARYLVTITEEWQRFEATSNLGEVGGGTFYGIDFRGPTTAQAVELCFPQLEAGPVATSYIPTGSATTDRAADLLTVPVQDGSRAFVFDFDYLGELGPTAVTGNLRRLIRYGNSINSGAGLRHYTVSLQSTTGNLIMVAEGSSGPVSTASFGQPNEGRNIIYAVFSDNYQRAGLHGGDSVTRLTSIGPVTGLIGMGVGCNPVNATDNTNIRARRFMEILNPADPEQAYAQVRAIAEEWAA